MPFVSKAQRRWMYANKPGMAQKWEDHTPNGAKLPEHVKAKKKKKRKTGKQMLKAAFIPKKYKGYKVKVDNKMKWFGDTDVDKKIIRINKKKSIKHGGHMELKDTVFHEKYHAAHPKALEKTTYKKTRQYIKKLKKKNHV